MTHARCPICCQVEAVSDGVFLPHTYIDEEYVEMSAKGPINEYSDGGPCSGGGREAGGVR